jgi:heterogeneous nuclear rnp K-like protein
MTAASASQKRPLEEPSSPSGPGDQPDAKRPALDKVIKGGVSSDTSSNVEPPAATTITTTNVDSKPVKSETSEAAQNGSSQPPAVPDPSAIPTVTGQIPSTNGQPIVSTTASQDESQWLHIRAIISSAEAATVIGKGGENVTLIRRHSGAKCTVSDYSRGAVERILTVSGAVDAVAKVSPSLSFLSFVKVTNFLGIWFDNSYSQQ